MLGVLLVMLSGCDRGIPRESVSGAVTLDGKPLDKASILFTPLSEGPSAGGEIHQGRYELVRDRGPGPSKYRVEITAYRPTGKTIFDSATGTNDEQLVAIIPARYNTRSELEVNIEPGAENTFDFHLYSR